MGCSVGFYLGFRAYEYFGIWYLGPLGLRALGFRISDLGFSDSLVLLRFKADRVRRSVAFFDFLW